MQHLPEPNSNWALFLDVDGTLIHLADHPDRVQPVLGLVNTLHQAADVLNGALALVSGRSIENIEHLLGANDLAVAGLHGQHIRAADGRILRAPDKLRALEHAAEQARALAHDHPGVYVEDKTYGIALHYRNAPGMAKRVRAFASQIMTQCPTELETVAGKSVLELKPAGCNKGTAIETFMTDTPFTGRIPVCVGDDVTDEDGFRAVNAMKGFAIQVGDDTHQQTLARYGLANVDEVHQWLRTLTTTLS